MREIGTEAFCKCTKLKRVVCAEESRLEKIGDSCFWESGIEEITLPSTLENIEYLAFFRCDNLKTIRLEGEDDIHFSVSKISDSAQIIFLSASLPGGVFLQDLRMMKSVAIPDGVEKVGNEWFRRSGIENITIPASV